RWIFRRIVGIYFRDVEVAGEVPGKDTGGRLFAANHVNALVDPILVLTQAPCDVSPVAKSTLWKIPGLKWLLEAADAVPIVRRRVEAARKTLAAASPEIVKDLEARLGAYFRRVEEEDVTDDLLAQSSDLDRGRAVRAAAMILTLPLAALAALLYWVPYQLPRA